MPLQAGPYGVECVDTYKCPRAALTAGGVAQEVLAP